MPEQKETSEEYGKRILEDSILIDDFLKSIKNKSKKNEALIYKFIIYLSNDKNSVIKKVNYKLMKD